MAELDHQRVLADIIDVVDVENRWQRVTGHLLAIGMDQINYGLFDTTASQGAEAGVQFISTMDSGWIEYYGDRGFDTADPHVALVRANNLRPYRWVETSLPHYEDPDERQVLAMAAEAGLRAQLQVTLTGTDGSLRPVGGLAMGSSLGAELFRAVDGLEAHLITIAHLFHQRSIGELRRRHSSVPKLSLRERDCLQYLAAGQRIDSVAEKLGLSRVTIELHLRNARRKLKAATLPEAVAKAIFYQEITVG